MRPILAIASRLALAVLMLGAVAGCRRPFATQQTGLTPVRLQLDWYPQPEHGGFYTALLRGYYKAEGLDVTLLPLPQYGSVARAVASGMADVGLGSSDQILEWNSNELPLVAVAATMQHDPQAIMVHANSPIHNFRDLDGHTIAAQTGATWLKYVVSCYQLHNVRQVPSTFSIANFLTDPDYVQQVFVTSEPFFAHQAGAQIRVILISSSGYDPYRVQFTTRAFASQHPDVVARFVRASIHGWQDYLRDPSATDSHLLALNPALNPAQEAYTAQALRDGAFVRGDAKDDSEIGTMTAARWQASYRQLNALKLFTESFDPSATYSLKFSARN